MRVFRFTCIAVLAAVLLQWSASAHEFWPGKRGFEVWIADQSDTRAGYGGQILIYDGDRLYRKRPEQAVPVVRLDLGGETSDLCRAATGRNPVRPHMILFNS